MSDIDDIIDTLDLRGHGHVLGGMIIRARAELAQLRATVAAQAEQLEAARRVIMAWYIVDRNECGYDIFPDMKELGEIDLYESGDPLLPWALGLRTAWLAAPAPQAQPPEEQRVSDVELAAYRFYLGESSDRLCELFEDMLTDERERYHKANAQAEEQST